MSERIEHTVIVYVLVKDYLFIWFWHHFNVHEYVFENT